MEAICQLAMYALEEIQPATDVFFGCVQRHASVLGLAIAPLTGSAVITNNDNIMLKQVCGLPLISALRDKVAFLAAPVYKCDGCTGALYSSVVVVHEQNGDLTTLDELRATVTGNPARSLTLAVNDKMSCSGALLLSALLGPDCADKLEVLYTGSHVDSLRAVQQGTATLAAIDCVTFALLCRHRCAAVAGLRQIGFTASVPSLPYVTAATTGAAARAILAEALRLAVADSDPAVVAARAALLLDGFVFPPDMQLQHYEAAIAALLGAARGAGQCSFQENLARRTDRSWLRAQQPSDALFFRDLAAALSALLGNNDRLLATVPTGWQTLPDGRSMRIVLPGGASHLAALCRPWVAPVFAVGFLGCVPPFSAQSAGYPQAVRDCWLADDALVAQLDANLVLGYVTAEVQPGGDWGNLVLLKNEFAAEEFAASPTHARVSADVAPRYYQAVQIHRLSVSPARLVFHRTLAMTFMEEKIAERRIFFWEPVPLTKRLTLLLLTRANDTEVLLGLKQRGFGVGKWNGFGGKVEKGETVLAAALREMKEESGVEVTDARRKAVLRFEMCSDGNRLEVHVFAAQQFTGTVTPSDEMQPQWWPVNQLPFEKMWLDDAHWMPVFFSTADDTLFMGDFRFEDHATLAEFVLRVEGVSMAHLDNVYPLDQPHS